MEYPGPPHDGADRSSSDQDGLLFLESLSPSALLLELNRGQPGRFRASDVPNVQSLLGGISDEADFEQDFQQDFEQDFEQDFQVHTKRIREWALRPFSFLCRMDL